MTAKYEHSEFITEYVTAQYLFKHSKRSAAC